MNELENDKDKEKLDRIMQGILDGKIKLTYRVDFDQIAKKDSKVFAEVMTGRHKMQERALFISVGALGVVLVLGFLYLLGIVGSINYDELNNKNKAVAYYHLGNADLYLNYQTNAFVKIDSASSRIYIDKVDGEIFVDNMRGTEMIQVKAKNFSFMISRGRAEFVQVDGLVRLICIDGLVSVQSKGDNPTSVQLLPGRYFDFVPGENFTIEKTINTPLPERWTDINILSYNKMPLSRVLKDIQIRSGATISIDPPIASEIENLTVTGNFSITDGVDNVLLRMLPQGFQITSRADSTFLIQKNRVINNN